MNNNSEVIYKTVNNSQTKSLASTAVTCSMESVWLCIPESFKIFSRDEAASLGKNLQRKFWCYFDSLNILLLVKKLMIIYLPC